MLFPRNPAKGGTSGPQPRFGGKKIQKMKVRKDDQTLTGNHHPPILGLFFSIPDICRGRAGFVSEGTRPGPRGKNSENPAKPEEAFS
jgi:hypothetical protein